MDRLGIERTCLSGLGRLCRMQDDDAVLRAMRAFPDRIVGFVYVRPGFDTPEKIARYHGLGFRGVKAIFPAKPYDSPEYHDLWAAASELAMPVLFHTGVVTAPGALPGDDISSERMRYHLLEPIARAFPTLNLIMAHCGISFTMEASDIIRLIPNIYCDISGAAKPSGWRNRLTPERFREFFWWDGAFDKILFGTDVHWKDMGAVLDADRDRYRRLGLSEAQEARIFSDNARRLLGLD